MIHLRKAIRLPFHCDTKNLQRNFMKKEESPIATMEKEI